MKEYIEFKDMKEGVWYSSDEYKTCKYALIDGVVMLKDDCNKGILTTYTGKIEDRITERKLYLSTVKIQDFEEGKIYKRTGLSCECEYKLDYNGIYRHKACLAKAFIRMDLTKKNIDQEFIEKEPKVKVKKFTALWYRKGDHGPNALKVSKRRYENEKEFYEAHYGKEGESRILVKLMKDDFILK